MGETAAIPPLSEIEFGDIEGRGADTNFGSYLVNRSVSGEYRDSGRAVDCDVFKTHSETNMTRRENGTSERTIQRFARSLPKSKNRLKGFQKKRNRTDGRRNFAETRHARIAEAAGVNVVDYYAQRMT